MPDGTTEADEWDDEVLAGASRRYSREQEWSLEERSLRRLLSGRPTARKPRNKR
jgi:hypothetical protein